MIYPIRITDLKETRFGREKYLWLDNKKSHQMVVNLGEKIRKKVRDKKMAKPEVLVAVARGALAWVKTLADWLEIEDIEVIQVVHYSGIGKRLKKPVLLKGVNRSVENKNVLLFDNLADTGKTLKLSLDYLNLTTEKEVKSATLIFKPGSAFKPDFYVFKTNAWVIFHHEVVETIRLLSLKWLKDRLSKEEIKERFLKIGMPKKEVEEGLKIFFGKENAKDKNGS